MVYNLASLLVYVLFALSDSNEKLFVCIVSFIVALISSATVYLAKIKVEELVRLYK